jgi:hypothetical protein
MRSSKTSRDKVRHAATILLIAPLFWFLSCICFAQNRTGQKLAPAGDFVRRVMSNELRAEQEDHSHWIFRLETKKPNGETEVDEVVETKDGDLKQPILINGHAVSGEQREKADKQIQQLVRNPGPLRKARAAEDQDAARSQRLLKMLPDAFNFTYGQQQGDLMQLNFSPNPGFRPRTHEAKVFHAMLGSLWVDDKQQR